MKAGECTRTRCLDALSGYKNGYVLCCTALVVRLVLLLHNAGGRDMANALRTARLLRMYKLQTLCAMCQ